MQLLKVFKRFTDRFFGIKEVERVYPVCYKTRTQLVEEGRVADIPRCYRYNQSISKKNIVD